MQLKIYNAENASGIRAGKPLIRLPKKGGLIFLNAVLTEALKLEPGMKISIAQDEKQVLDWWLFIDPKKGFELRKAGDKSLGLVLNSRLLAEDLRACAPAEVDDSSSIKMTVGTEPHEVEKVKYYAIITKSARK